MNCAFDKEKLSGYYDGELGAAEKAEVERHIASCSECLRDLGDLKSAALLVRDLPRLRAPKSVAEGVSREIQAAGKVHVFARARRTLLWASAAAAGLFVVMNVMYFSAQEKNPPRDASAPMASSVARSDPMGPPATPAPQPEAKDGRSMDLAKAIESDRATKPVERRATEAPAAAAPLRQEQAESAKQLEELRKTNEETVNRKKVMAADKEGGGAAPKPGAAPAPATVAPPAAAEPVPPPPAPTAPPKPLADAPAKMKAVEAKPADDAVAEKAASKRELDAVPKTEADVKSRVAVAGAPAELPPVLCNVISTQLAKSKPRLEEALKNLGIPVAPLAAAQPTAKAPRSREVENTIVVEMTESQFLKLREEMEKPGDTRLQVASPVDPVLPGFGRGGLFAKKDTASGGAKAMQAGKGEAKEAESAAPAAKSGADLGAAAEPRRKVTLKLVEAKTLPAADAEPGKKQ